MNSLDRINESVNDADCFGLDLSSEEFRQNALNKYAIEWAHSAPFYARRFGLPVAVVSRAADFREVMLDSERFVMRTPDLPGYEAFDIFGGLVSVLQMDGDRHQRVRRLMAPAFAAVHLDAIKGSVQRIVDERLDTIEMQSPFFDAVEDFSEHLILRSLLDATFGLSEDEQQVFERGHRAMFAPNFDPGQPRPPEYEEAIDGVRKLIERLIDERRRSPRDDFIGRLISARDNEHRLSEAELFGQINTVCAAALGSTSASLSAAIMVLLKNPEQLELLKSRPELIDSAVDECLRVHCPGMFVFPRFAAADTIVSGTRIYRDMIVLGSPQCANVDPDEFSSPDRFDIERKAQNYTFGVGPHHCIGFRLAKTTMKIALSSLLKRFPQIRFASQDFTPQYRGNVGTLFLTRLPLSV